MADTLDFQKGSLDLMVLKSLTGGPAHGYAIGRWIEQVTGDVLRVGESALYPALHRLEERKFVVAKWGITKTKREAKFYRITALGRKRLVTGQDEWKRFAVALAAVLAAEPSFA